MTTPVDPRSDFADSPTQTIGVTKADRARTEPYDDIRDKIIELPRFGGDGYAVMDLFPIRHKLIAEMDPHPRSVFEFGAYRGYFLVTALDAAPEITRIGWIDNEAHTSGSNEMVRQNLLHYNFEYRGENRMPHVWYETSAYRSVEFGEAELVQVDGEHTYPATMTDLIWARQMGPRMILVDDWRAFQSVREAVTHFCALYGWTNEVVETVNGLAVLRPQLLAQPVA